MTMFRTDKTEFEPDMFFTACWIVAVLALVLFTRGKSLVLLNSAIGGFIAWQVFEWFFHRHVLHTLFRKQHDMHHRFPAGNYGVPMGMAQAVVGFTLLLFFVTMGLVVGGGAFVGFTFGYLTYTATHYVMHHLKWPRTGFLGGPARRHDLHHRGVAANYNVLLPFADMVFGTYRRA